jgi:hypothetical protein
LSVSNFMRTAAMMRATNKSASPATALPISAERSDRSTSANGTTRKT